MIVSAVAISVATQATATVSIDAPTAVRIGQGRTTTTLMKSLTKPVTAILSITAIAVVGRRSMTVVASHVAVLKFISDTPKTLLWVYTCWSKDRKNAGVV